mgnify:CR=1 FL=1
MKINYDVNFYKLNDDIYVTGNLGDSFVGLQLLKNKIKVSKKIKDYFLLKKIKQMIMEKLDKIKHRF